MTAAMPASPGRGLFSRLFSGIAWNAAGTVFNQGSTFVVSVVVANFLGRELFGEYAIVLGTLATVSTMAQLAMGYTATKFLAELRSVDRPRAGRVLGLCLAVSVLAGVLAGGGLAAGARVIAERVLRAPQLGPLLTIAAVAVFFGVVNAFLLGALAGLEAYRSLAQAGLVAGLVYLALCLFGAWRAGLPGLLIGVAASSLFQVAVLLVSVWKEAGRQGLRVDFRGLLVERSLILRFAFPAALSGISYMTATWLASACLVRQPRGLSEIAIFAAAANYRVIVLFLPSVINNVAMSILNHNVGLKEQAQFHRLLSLVVRLHVVTTVLAAALVGVLIPFALRLFGAGFSGGKAVLAILLGSAVIQPLWYAAAQTISSGGEMWRVFLWGTVPRDLLIVGLMLWLVPAFGALGLAVAETTGWLTAFVILAASNQDRLRIARAGLLSGKA